MNYDTPATTASIEQPELMVGLKEIVRFTTDFKEEAMDVYIKLALETCLISDVPDFSEAEDRQDMNYVMKRLMELMKAVYAVGRTLTNSTFVPDNNVI